MRLIDADSLCRKIKEAYWIAHECGAHEAAVFYNALHEEVEKAKTVDAVAVVRCSDCKFFHECEGEDSYCEQLGIYGMLLEGFCNEGERR